VTKIIQEGGKSLRGVAEVTVKPSGRIQVLMNDRAYNFDPGDPIPEGMVNGTYAVSMSESGDKLWSIRPAVGLYRVRFTGIAGKEGEPPTPKLVQGGPRTGKDGKHWVALDKYQFTLLFEIVTGKCKGMAITYTLDYLFKRYMETDEVYVPDRGGAGSASKKLIEVMSLLGFDWTNDSIPWSENILPWLEAWLLKKPKRNLVVILKDGWIDSIASEDEDDATPTQEKTDVVKPSEPDVVETPEQKIAALQAQIDAQKKAAAEQLDKEISKASAEVTEKLTELKSMVATPPDPDIPAAFQRTGDIKVDAKVDWDAVAEGKAPDPKHIEPDMMKLPNGDMIPASAYKYMQSIGAISPTPAPVDPAKDESWKDLLKDEDQPGGPVASASDLNDLIPDN
jgi:hypothetical protein